MVLISKMTNTQLQLLLLSFSYVLLTVRLSSLVNCRFKFFAQIKIVSFVFLSLNFKNSLCILDISPLADLCIANNFFHSVA